MCLDINYAYTRNVILLMNIIVVSFSIFKYVMKCKYNNWYV